MVWAAGIAGVALGLMVVYLLRPVFPKATVSFARYIHPMATSSEPERRFRLRNLLLPLVFWVQLLFIGLLLSSLLLTEFALPLPEYDDLAVGVWLVIDQSASMSARAGGQSHLDLARLEARRVVDYLRELPEDVAVCARLSSFDLALLDQTASLDLRQNSGPLLAALDALEVRPLGTDVINVGQVIERAAGDGVSSSEQNACPITAVVVISDIPAPDWFIIDATGDADENTHNLAHIWCDVGDPVSNVGFTRATWSQQIALGSAPALLIEVQAYKAASGPSTVTITGPGGDVALVEELAWPSIGTQTFRFEAPAPGRYTLRLTPDDAYTYDNELHVTIAPFETVRVDWQLPDRGWFDALGWEQVANSPYLRVMRYPGKVEPGVPTLLVGDGYAVVPPQDAIPVNFFYESSPILNDISIDVAETLRALGPTPQSDAALPIPVLLKNDGQMLLAANDEALAAYVPGLPQLTSGDENLSAFSTTVFFNAVYWLLQNRALPDLYALTSLAHPDPDDWYMVLHPDEGNTGRASGSQGAIGDLDPNAQQGQARPAWPLWLALAAVVFLVERGLWRGR